MSKGHTLFRNMKDDNLKALFSPGENVYTKKIPVNTAGTTPKFPREIKLALCPKIYPHGWWWKKHIPHLRKKYDLAQRMLEKVWVEGGFELYLQMMGDALQKELLDNGCKAIYTDEKN